MISRNPIYSPIGLAQKLRCDLSQHPSDLPALRYYVSEVEEIVGTLEKLCADNQRLASHVDNVVMLLRRFMASKKPETTAMLKQRAKEYLNTSKLTGSILREPADSPPAKEER